MVSGRHAIIYLPGSVDGVRERAETIAKHLANAIDRAAGEGPPAHELGNIREETIKDSQRARVCPVIRRESDGTTRTVADVYVLGYHDLLVGRYRNMPLGMQMLFLPLAAVPLLLALIASFTRPGRIIGVKEKCQLLFGFLAVLLLTVYMVSLGVALVAQGLDIARPESNASVAASTTPTTSGASAEPRTESGRLATWVASLRGGVEEGITLAVLVATALGLALPERVKFQRSLSDLATSIIAVVMYLRAGEQQRELSGQLTDLVEYLRERPAGEVEAVHLVAYSFGTIVAIDTLFPPDRSAPETLNSVRTLTTIASPFDLICLLSKDYFDRRQPLDDIAWYNIYSPHDVFASTLRSDANAHSPGPDEDAASSDATLVKWMAAPTNLSYPTQMGSDRLTWLDVLFFLGLRSHTKYWNDAAQPQDNVFKDVVKVIFEGDPLLA